MRVWFLSFGVAFAAVLIFWMSIEAVTDENWSPEVYRQVTGVIDDNVLTLTNMLDFRWRTATDFDENWITRSYDLSAKRSRRLPISLR